MLGSLKLPGKLLQSVLHVSQNDILVTLYVLLLLVSCLQYVEPAAS